MIRTIHLRYSKIIVPSYNFTKLLLFVQNAFVNLKEVVAQNTGNAEQLLGVDARLTVYFIHIFAAAVQLLGKPRNRTPLLFHALLYYFTYVYVVVLHADLLW